MAELLTLKDMADGHVDAGTLGEFANEDKVVFSRKGLEYPSAPMASRLLVENGMGGDVKPFLTKTALDADPTLLDNAYAVVLSDPDINKNGFYQKRGSIVVRLEHNLQKYFEAYVSEIATITPSKNLYDKSKKISGSYIVGTGEIKSAVGWAISSFIPVVAGQTYTISANARRAGAAFFVSNGDKFAISGTYNDATGSVTMTAPPTAKYLVVNIDSSSLTASNVQVEKGSTATTYEAYSSTKVVNKASLPSDIAYLSDLTAERDYELTVTSKNLFNKAAMVREGLLVLKTNGSTSPSAGWACSTFIPVVAGQTYTLSGSRSRAGLSFFANATDATAAIIYNDDPSIPLTVTAPANANYLVFNIYSNTTTGQFENLMLEVGSTASAYQVYGDYKALDYSYLTNVPPSIDSVVNTNQLEILSNNAARITAKNDINLQLDLLLTRSQSYDMSTVFNFMSDKIDNTVVRSPTDDVAPLRADNTTIGANHGYRKAVITMAAHGKTASDIGSVWSDGVNQWVLIYIESSSKIAVSSRLGNISLSANSLTHVSGAVNTAAINTTSKTEGQWYPAFKNRKLNVQVDGLKIDTSVVKTYGYSDTVAFHESYEIMAKTDIIEWLIANKGQAWTSYDAAPSILCNYSYVFDKDGGCTIYASITALKEIPFTDWMVTQSFKVADDSRKYYVPKTVAFTQDGVNYNFSQLQPMPNAITSSLYFDAAKNESGANPVDRLIQFDSNVGYATGYLPLLDAEPSKRLANAATKYLEVRNSSLKIYPRLLDSSKSTLDAGDSFGAVAYRKYFKRDANRTAKYVVRSNIADFLYLDWHSAKTDVVTLPDDLVGRSFTVHEKSSNVTVLSKFATNNIAVKIDSTKSYGYLVLRFDK